MSDPEISVVISTRLRETRLAFALDALAGQTLPAGRFEVIVVRSGDAIDPPLTPAPPNLRLRSLVCLEGGTAVKRNLGWHSARAELVAFTDDDCRPSPGWLEALLAARTDAETLLQGPTVPDPEEEHLLHGLARSIRISEPPSWYETCNIAYPRAMLERLGGFDERFEFLGDDTDLGCRARESGAGIEFVEAALVWHAVHWRTLPQALAGARKLAPLPALVRAHPRQRAQLRWGAFAYLEDAYLLLGFAGLLMRRRAPALTALAAAPYLHKRIDRNRLTPWGLLRLPTQFGSRLLVDATQLATLLACSIRARTLVL